MVVKINGLYSHVAWSDAPDGSVGFTLDEDDDASYIGHITSLNGEEVTDPLRYTWTENTQQEEDESDSAEDDGLAEQVALNTTDNRGTQAASDTGIGNDNELDSTNAGTDGWKWDESKILAESVVIDPYDAGKPVNGIKLTAKSYPGKVLFECGPFVSKLEAIDASDIGSHTYTISLDVMMSSVFSVTSPSVISGDSALLSFEDLEPDSMYEDIPMDGAWYHYTSTAQAIAEDAGDGGALCFDLSNMPSGSVLEIANLKLEAGANATPWKRSAAEAQEAADAAQKTAYAANTAASKAQSTADSANTAAGNAQSTADGAATAAGKAQESVDTLETMTDKAITFDTSYTFSTTDETANFEAHVYRYGEDVTAEYADSCFSWWRKLEGERTSGDMIRFATGKTCTVSLADCGYGASIVGQFETSDDASLLTTSSARLQTLDAVPLTAAASGESVRVSDLPTATPQFDDWLMGWSASSTYRATVANVLDAALQIATKSEIEGVLV